MAVTKVQIRGRVLLPDGSPPSSGKLIVKLNRPGRTLDGAETVDVIGEVSVTLGAGGTLPTTGTTLDLVPNDAITPSGTHYVASYVLRMPSGKSYTPAEKWQLGSGDLTLDIGAVPRIDEASGATYTLHEAVQASVLASATASAAAASASAAAAAASETAAGDAQASAQAAAVDAQASAFRTRLASIPLEVPGARKAKIIGLRANLLNMRTLSAGAYAGQEYPQPGGYAGCYFGEVSLIAQAYPGWWTAAKCREILDVWAASYRPATHDFAYGTATGATYLYNLGWTPGNPQGPIPDFAIFLALTIERGDSTAWAAYGGIAVEALDAMARSGGLIYNNPASPGLGWGYYDVLTLDGGCAMLSAHAAYAYTRLAILADPTLMTQANALVAGLEALRRADGYWNASTNTLQADVTATAFIAAHGLCSTGEALEAGTALVNDYRAGLITSRGGVRSLRYPETWPAGDNPNGLAEGVLANGGYVTGFKTDWLCQAMAKAGRVDDAKRLMGEQIQGWLAHHRINANGPQETYTRIPPALTGFGLTGSFGAGLVNAVEPPAQDITLTLSGAALSSAVALVDDGHSIDSIEMVSGASTTATIAVTASQRTHNAWTDEAGVLPNSAPTTKLAVLSTFQSFQSQFMLGINSALSWGGAIMAAFTSGSSAGAVILRLLQRGLRKPRLVSRSQSMTPWSDLFSADSLASYICSRPTNWAITGGYLGPVRTQVNEWVLAPLRVHDADVESNLYTSFSSGYWPRMVARWKDQANYLYIQYAGGTTLQVYDVIAGVPTSIGSFVTTLADGVDQYTRIRLRGNQVTITSGAISNTYTTNVTWPGLCGVGNTCTNARINFAQPTVQFRDLTITPVHTAQRDMVSDGLTPYTRTGTWTVSANRLRSVDTAAPLVAYHADPTPAQSVGVTGTFTSANWATKPAGLCTLASSADQLLFAICNGTTVSLYSRVSGVDTLLGTMTLAASVANGADLTMTLRTHVGQVVVKVGSQYMRRAITSAFAAGSAGAYCPNAGGSAAEISYSVLRVDTYPAAQAHGQTIPPGYVLDSGISNTATASDDTHANLGHGGSLGPVYLRDESGAVVDSQADSDDVCVVY